MLRSHSKKPFQLQPPSKLIIDSHGGLQDILAIVFAYNLIKNSGSHQEIIGITCVSGKNSLDDAVHSALVANKILGAGIPVYRGQGQSLMLSKEYPKVYMDQKFTHVEKRLYAEIEADKDIHKLVQKEKAVDFLAHASQKYGKNLGIIAFGPLTNLALAQRLQNSLDQVKVLSLMGGQVYGMGNTVGGNVQPNFAHDPLAAGIVFEIQKEGPRLKQKIYVNPIENTLTFCFKQAINLCLDSGKLSQKIDDIFVNMMGINSIVLNCGPILTILPIIAPKCLKNAYHIYGEIVKDTGDMDGLLALNWIGNGLHPYESYMYVYEEFDKDIVNDLFVSAFTKN